MDIREIWPEPRIPRKKRMPPPIPAEIEVFQRKIEKTRETGSERALSQILSDIVDLFMFSAFLSTSEKKVRSVKSEVKKIALLFGEANRAVSGYREAEAKARVINLVKKQINKKQNLINKLKLKEKQKEGSR